MPRYVGELVTAAAIILIAGYVLWLSQPLPAGGGLFPGFAAVCTILLSLYWVWDAVTNRHDPARAESIVFDTGFQALKPMLALAASIAYVALMSVAGFFLTTTLFLVGLSLMLGVRSWRMIGLTAIILMPLIYAFFVAFLGARLPQGFAI
jgi:hypothetical protein